MIQDVLDNRIECIIISEIFISDKKYKKRLQKKTIRSRISHSRKQRCESICNGALRDVICSEKSVKRVPRSTRYCKPGKNKFNVGH